ncbi:hypothetical protein RHMOL_Rhmol07G0254600 [Rhododendron molle]|uniref:Uncharacterized protein n=1 Tax=Rhododendron molle TaxID=49168 RepID=A0ACC0N4L3_RHOML|nr:hypothetical protein RHMOL_Rhmol07G0254600 [Rhododendron molle]
MYPTTRISFRQLIIESRSLPRSDLSHLMHDLTVRRCATSYCAHHHPPISRIDKLKEIPKKGDTC